LRHRPVARKQEAGNSSQLNRPHLSIKSPDHDDSTTPLPKWLLTKREIATVLNVSPRTIDNWVAQKRIPFFRLSPRLLRFDLRKVQIAIERYEVREVGRRL
jgi:excisionase family DNA binding protein